MRETASSENIRTKVEHRNLLRLLVVHKWLFSNLVYLNTGTTAAVLLLLPILPAGLMSGKDQ